MLITDCVHEFKVECELRRLTPKTIKGYDTSASECKTYMVKKNALGYVFQKAINIEEEREAKLLATDIVASSLYVCKGDEPT